jgi:SAM-dependent methyltransferase
MKDRQSILYSLFDVSGVGLEIGASYNPIVPKASGHRIEVLDYTTAEVLREKYRNEPNVDVSRIEEVDYVSDGRSIVEVVGKRNHYDYIVASHNIEHVPDLLGFLRDCQTLLKDTGVLVLAVPHKTRCFDLLQPLSTTGQVLQASLEKRTRHTPGSVFDYEAYSVSCNETPIWTRGERGRIEFGHTLQDARDAFGRAKEGSHYIDIHAWHFVPSSFRLVMHELAELGYIGLRERSFIDTRKGEFFVSMDMKGSGRPVDRLALLKRAQSEYSAALVNPGHLLGSLIRFPAWLLLSGINRFGRRHPLLVQRYRRIVRSVLPR